MKKPSADVKKKKGISLSIEPSGNRFASIPPDEIAGRSGPDREQTRQK
jgi:hypothetical protein